MTRTPLIVAAILLGASGTLAAPVVRAVNDLGARDNIKLFPRGRESRSTRTHTTEVAVTTPPMNHDPAAERFPPTSEQSEPRPESGKHSPSHPMHDAAPTLLSEPATSEESVTSPSPAFMRNRWATTLVNVPAAREQSVTSESRKHHPDASDPMQDVATTLIKIHASSEKSTDQTTGKHPSSDPGPMQDAATTSLQSGNYPMQDGTTTATSEKRVISRKGQNMRKRLRTYRSFE